MRSPNFNQQSGLGLIEALAVICLLAVVGLALARTLITDISFSQKLKVRESVEALARSQLEFYSTKNPANLQSQSSFDVTESNLTAPNLGSEYQFTRDTDISITPANTVKVRVTVTSNHPRFPMSFQSETAIAKE